MQTIIKQFSKNGRALSFIRSSSLIAFIFSFLLCASLGIIFIGFQIPLDEAIMLFVKTLLTTWLFIVIFKLSFSLLLWSIAKVNSYQLFSVGKRVGSVNAGVLIMAVSIFLLSCKGVPTAGINKDLNTGMVTTYSNLKPEESVLVMNEEKLAHTQIPLGEKFVVINNKVKGLTVKDDKVSIGCSLIISDSKGKELLHEEDLFKNDGGIYDKKDAEYLKCTVSTGKPMEYDQEYKVAVKFWDKYGTGSIENKFSIAIIDLP